MIVVWQVNNAFKGDEERESMHSIIRQNKTY